ncbi:hypothetical protein [Aquabacter spiritensis]|uniref:Uncharacterized protein n=1 Tax=Aquabacter spiritensis TaxID=933073 RepID=A0A4R3M503_9HYPH|nr:hypothetical protein [Aquabacter spiritensis]TCT07663.1 hypothetical protein EDC64_101182 [Aquabacter spiritensis]
MNDDTALVDRVVDASIDLERAIDRLKDTLRARKFRQAVEILEPARQAEMLDIMTEMTGALRSRTTEYETLLDKWDAHDAEMAARRKLAEVAAAAEVQAETTSEATTGIKSEAA